MCVCVCFGVWNTSCGYLSPAVNFLSPIHGETFMVAGTACRKVGPRRTEGGCNAYFSFGASHVSADCLHLPRSPKNEGQLLWLLHDVSSPCGAMAWAYGWIDWHVFTCACTHAQNRRKDTMHKRKIQGLQTRVTCRFEMISLGK